MSKGLDTSAAVTETAAAAAIARGCGFICRYYATNSKLPKVMGGGEAIMLSGKGLDVVSVFQNYNDAKERFSAELGRANGEAALKYAGEMNQPPGTAIYFAVDYDAAPSDAGGAIKDYFAAVKKAIGGKYKVGVYGSGLVCDAMKRQYKLAAYSWLAGATGWRGSKDYEDWNIRQYIIATKEHEGAVNIGGITFNSNESKGGFGGWNLRGGLLGLLLMLIAKLLRRFMRL